MRDVGALHHAPPSSASRVAAGLGRSSTGSASWTYSSTDLERLERIGERQKENYDARALKSYESKIETNFGGLLLSAA